MAERLSRAELHVVTNDPVEINDVLMRLRQELDQVQGLNGRARVYDRMGVEAPTVNTDAARLDDVVTIGSQQTIVGAKTFTTPFVVVDAQGNIIHAFGANL